MNDLIEALQIFLKYVNPRNPTQCEHDVLYVACDPGLVSEPDKAKLKELGFLVDNDLSGFYSYRFGAA